MTETEAVLTLMRGAKQLYARSFEPIIKAYAVNQLETDILLFLYNNPDFDTAQEICDLRGLSKSNVSGAVERLCGRGWLERRRDEQNRRIIHLTLTPEAADFVEQASALQRSAFEKLSSALSPEELAMARSIGMKLLDHIALLLSKREA